jgi:hypothetical protein
MNADTTTIRSWARAIRIVLIATGVTLAFPLIAQTPTPDICGCRDNPNSLGAFDLRDRNTWPPGTTVSGSSVTIPLPADGVMVFDSMFFDWSSAAVPTCCPVRVSFAPNAANTPVTLLVKGNVTINASAMVTVEGADGAAGSAGGFGPGGLGGNGGFRGGDGANRIQFNVTDGAPGLGPGNGTGGTTSTSATGASFIGAADLLPLAGGSGGGGGRSQTSNTSCAGGGGGGGGGALLLALNGALVVNYTGGGLMADGGNGGAANGFSCATGGSGGSGGAIRVIANSVAGTGRMFARGGSRWEDGSRSGSGSIRIEALTNTFPANFTDPVAFRTSAPGPITNPYAPRISLTAVAGQPISATPLGVFNGIDVQIPVPGPITIDLATDGVPSGTTVDVKVKARVGGAVLQQTLPISNCDGSGHCLLSATFDLAAGVYAVEARATFQAAP